MDPIIEKYIQEQLETLKAFFNARFVLLEDSVKQLKETVSGLTPQAAAEAPILPLEQMESLLGMIGELRQHQEKILNVGLQNRQLLSDLVQVTPQAQQAPQAAPQAAQQADPQAAQENLIPAGNGFFQVAPPGAARRHRPPPGARRGAQTLQNGFTQDPG